MQVYHFGGVNGQKKVLTECDDLVIVKTVGLFDPMEMLIDIGWDLGISQIDIVDEFPEASVFVYRLIGTGSIRKSKELLKDLVRIQKHPSIVFIGSVLCDQQGAYQIYTGNIFIKFEDTALEAEHRNLIESYGLKIKMKLGFDDGAYFVEPNDEIGKSIFALCEELLNLEQVQFCHPELVVARKAIQIEHAGNIDTDSSSWAIEMVELEDAWQISKGSGVKICIIDDGLDFDHPAFNKAGKVFSSRDMFGDGRGHHCFDSEMHGTACASIACSNDPNAPGVAPDAQLIVVRTKGLGSVLEAEAIRWAVDQGADIISCSWGPSDGRIQDPSDDYYEHAIPDHTRLAIQYAARSGRGGKGCLVFFAAGNGSEFVETDGYASDPNVMAVGAVNKQKAPSRYSDRGYPLFACFPSSEVLIKEDHLVHLYGLVAADRLGDKGYVPGNYFSSFGGTSAACPGMAGVSALMLSLRPDLTLAQCKDLLIQSCRLPSRNQVDYSPQYGFGIVNAKMLVENTLRYKNSKSTKMENTEGSEFKTRALHIGLNFVNSDIYGSPLTLGGCIADADFYQGLVNSNDNIQLLDQEATRTNVIREIRRLIQESVANDYVFITYAGHGSQVIDESGDEKDGKDETLVLFDGLLIDDEINNLLAEFQSGVNVVWISDSCHSGTNTRAVNANAKFNAEGVLVAEQDNMPARFADPAYVQKVYENNKRFYEAALNGLPKKNRSQQDELIPLKANVISIAACQDNEYAGDTPSNGLFTSKVRRILRESDSVTYREMVKNTSRLLPADKQPKLVKRGPKGHGLENEIFFKPNPRSGGKEKGQDEASSAQPRYADEGLVVSTSLSQLNYQHSDRRNIRSSETMRVFDGLLDAQGVRGMTDWDQSYEMIEHLDEGDKVDFIEPNFVSAINGNPEEVINRTSGRYIGSYPNPEARNHPQPIIWHLDEDHSQLRKALNRAMQRGGVKEPWSYKNKDQFPLIAHIDTGILPHHSTLPVHFEEELSRRFRDPRDKDKIFGFLQGEQQGHGHATVSILAGGALPKGNTENYSGPIGAFPYARVASLRISETVALLSGKKFADAVHYAVDILGADVVTMSMAGAPSLKMLEAVNYAYEKGVVVVAAAGNSWEEGIKSLIPDTIMYPARFNRVIGVTGATFDDTPYLVNANKDWKERAEGGENMQTCYGPDAVMRTVMAAYTPNVVWANKKNSYVHRGGGTSSATPQVAAAAALYLYYYRDQMKDFAPWERVEAVRKALFESAKPISASIFGNGILRADDALSEVPNKSDLLITPPDTLTKSWLHNLVDMYYGGRSTHRKDSILAMMSMEIEQAILSFPEFTVFRRDASRVNELKTALYHSPNISERLRAVIALDKDVQKPKGSARDQAGGAGVQTAAFSLQDQGIDDNILVFARGHCYNAAYHADHGPTNHVGQLSIDLLDTVVRSGVSSVEVRLPKDHELAFLIGEQDDQGLTTYTWHFPGIEQIDSGLRSMRAIEDPHVIRFNLAVSRNIFKRIVKTFVNLFRIAKDKAPSPLQGLVGYNMTAIDNSWQDAATLLERVAKQKKTLFLSHGTFSCTEASFRAAMTDKSFIEALLKKGYGEIALGFNHSTILSSVAINSKALHSVLKKSKLDIEKFSVIGHSRGGLVARHCFPTTTSMVLTGCPNLGTPIADKTTIVKYINTISNLAISVSGVTAPIILAIPFVLEQLAKFVFSNQGLEDQVPGSVFIKQLNKQKPLTGKQTLIATNFTANGLKVLVDRTNDALIFKGVRNDAVVPFASALSLDVGAPNRVEKYYDSDTHHLQYYDDGSVLRSILMSI